MSTQSTTFDESAHPRQAGGKFTTVQRDEPVLGATQDGRTALREFADTGITSGELFGENQHWWEVQVGDGETAPAVEWTEATAFHKGRFPELFDDDGWPRPGVADALQAALREEMTSEHIHVEEDPSGTDVPGFKVTVEMPDLGLDSTKDELADNAWPPVANLTNLFDPGTYGTVDIMRVARDRWKADRS